MKLNDLKINQEGVIKSVKANDNIKKRLLDIGLVKGVKIKPVLISPGGDMVAYYIKGALVAIRKIDTKDIVVDSI